MGRRRRKKRKSHVFGEHGSKVWAWEEPSGVWYLGWYDPNVGREVKESLRTRDEEEARRVGARKAEERRQGVDLRKAVRSTTAAIVFELYLKYRSPDKGAYCRAQDERLRRMYERFLGADFDLRHYSRREHDEFIRQRTSGEIDANGRYVADPDARVQVSPGTTGQDLAVLHAVFSWGMRFRDDNGQLLFKENPMRGLPIPKEKNPKREIATTDRVEAIRENAPKVLMRVEWNGSREYRESFLPEIFDLVVEQGRRIGAVCSLHTRDLRLDRTENEPYGATVWPADTDKMGKEWRCPLTERARHAVFRALRKREMVGEGWLFPAAKDRTRPVSVEQASTWMRKAEELAGLPRLDGTCFHSYRRLWATVRKDLPDVDVAQAGGWASLTALKTAYQRPDAATIRRVVMHQAELRELR